MNKTLSFMFRGQDYRVNENGEIAINGNKTICHSPTWRFLGGSRHHWTRRVEVSLADAFANPQLLNGCLGWDVDHGTVRQWGGSTADGTLPRISHAQVVNP